MNHALWMAKKNQICSIINKISNHYDGDDPTWLDEYCQEIIQQNTNDLDGLLDCVWSLEDQLKWVARRPLLPLNCGKLL